MGISLWGFESPPPHQINGFPQEARFYFVSLSGSGRATFLGLKRKSAGPDGLSSRSRARDISDRKNLSSK